MRCSMLWRAADQLLLWLLLQTRAMMREERVARAQQDEQRARRVRVASGEHAQRVRRLLAAQ